MKIVITGGNGYIGARLSLYLSRQGFEVIPICFPDIPSDPEWKSKMFSVYAGDLREEKTISYIAGLKADAVVHLVSLDHFDSEKDPRFVNEINVLPTWKLLDACAKEGLKKFIYFSTIQVYGKISPLIIDEKHPVQPGNAYGLTHFLSENICEYFNRKSSINVITTRLSNSYGHPLFQDNNCWWLAINDLCKNAFLNKKITLLSDGSPQRDFIHGDDVCKAVKYLIEIDIKDPENKIYHISSGKTLTLLELAFIVREVYKNRYGALLPISTPDKTISDSKLPSDISKFIISNDKIRTTGFSPSISISEGINELFNFLELNYGSTK